jgi:hypothetical protein
MRDGINAICNALQRGRINFQPVKHRCRHASVFRRCNVLRVGSEDQRGISANGLRCGNERGGLGSRCGARQNG